MATPVLRRLVLCSLVTLFLVGGPTPSFADPVVVTTPSGVRFDYEGDWFRFTAPGFSAQTDWDSWGFSIPRVEPASCVYCAPGDTVNPGFRTPGEVALWHGTATVGGVTYSDVEFRGSFDFQVTPTIFPEVAGPYYFPELPFTFTGVLRGFSGGDEVFVRSLTGTGSVWQVYFRLTDGPNQGRFQDEYGNRGFVFADAGAPAPVPEPTTMMLLGTGLAAVAARARKRRHAER